MEKSKFAGALRTLLNDHPVDRDLRQEDQQDEPRLLNEMELRLAAGGEDTPNW